MSNRNVILFDLDDTLVVEYESAQKAFMITCGYAKSFGVDPDILFVEIQKKARELWHSLPTYDYCRKIGISSWEGLWADFNGEDANVKQLHSLREYYQVESWNRGLLEFGFNDLPLASRLSDIFRTERRKLHIPIKNSINVLEALRNTYRLGIITNGIPDLQMEKIRGAQIEHYFEHITISGETGIGKPSKEIFLSAAERFNIGLDKVLVVGDSIETDIAGARNAGIKSIWFNNKNKGADNNAGYTSMITNLLQLKEIL